MATRDDRLRILIETVDKASGGLSSITKGLVGLGAAYVTWQSAQRIIQAGIEQIQQAVAAASAQEQADRRLALALRNVGDASASTLAHLKDLAGARQRDTLFADDQIQAAQSLLISLGRLTGQGLDRATTASLDLAQGLGIDLESAARLVGKAAAGATETFGRYGIIIDESIPKSERFAYILDQIRAKFGGAAQDAARGFAGSLQDVQEQFGEMQEALGQLIINSPTLQTLLKGAADMFERLAKIVGDGELERGLANAAESTLIVAEGFVKAARAAAAFVTLAGQPDLGLGKALNELDESIDRIQSRLSSNKRTRSWVEETLPAEGARASAAAIGETGKKVMTLAEYFKQLQTVTEDEHIQQLLFGGASRSSGPLQLEMDFTHLEEQSAGVAAYWANIAAGGDTTLQSVRDIALTLEEAAIPRLEDFIDLQETMKHAAADFAAELTYGIIQGDLALKDMIKNMVAGLAAAIVKALVLLAITKAIAAANATGPAGIAFGFGAGIASGLYGNQASRSGGGAGVPLGGPISAGGPVSGPGVSINLSVMGVTPAFVQEFQSVSADLARRYGYQVLSTGVA